VLGTRGQTSGDSDRLRDPDVRPQFVFGRVVHLAAYNEIWFVEILKLNRNFRVMQETRVGRLTTSCNSGTVMPSADKGFTPFKTR